MKRGQFLLASCLILLASAVAIRAQEAPAQPAAEQTEAAPAILPAESILTDVELLDITDHGARLHVISSRPLACAVVYGPTLAFGQLSVDQNMGASAHSDHNALMTGLQPDTLYYYRFQGSDVNGNLYVSQVMTFRTAPAQAPTANPDLLSPANGAQVIGVSSNYGGGPNDGAWGANNAFDGDSTTAWSSNNDGDHAWVQVQLGQRSHIHQISFWTRSMSNNTAQIYSFTVTSDDGTVYGPFTLPDPDHAYSFDVDMVATTLRFDVVSSNGGNTGAVEIAAYGEPAG